MQSPRPFEPVAQATAESEASEELSSEDLLEDARRALLGQSATLLSLSERLDHSFVRAVQLILDRPGRVVVCGIGKSGLVGRKLAATLSSTGTPSFFLHAAEAQHGDLGMVTDEDTVVMLSNSGNTQEVLALMPALRDLGVPVIALCGGGELEVGATVSLCTSVDRETCPLNLAPTTSTLVCLALGDALAMALSRARGFRVKDFAQRHPGGELGRRLCTRVRDVMQRDNLPLARPGESMAAVISKITQGRCGLAIVQGSSGELLGVITDGDLRRALQKERDLLALPAECIMTRRPLTISEEALVVEAEKVMETQRVKALLAVNHFGKVSGVIEFFAK